VYVDLHIHTQFSDGTYGPEQVAQIAKDKGLSAISVCDHDDIEAHPHIVSACASFNINVIRGVEIGTEWGGKNLHLLAYNFDPNNTKLLSVINSNKAEFYWHGFETIRNMQKDYPEISLDEFVSYNKATERGGWNSVNYIYDKGVGKTLFDAFKYLDTYGPKLNFINIVKACDAVLDAGGVPILAHPGEYWSINELEERLTSLLPVGIKGIECYHPNPKHTDAFVAKCIEFCKANKLCITCGGDSHGDFAQDLRGIGVMQIDSSKLNLSGILYN